MEDSKIIEIQSRIKGMVVYVIPDLQNLRRVFSQRETKKITFEELRMLANTPGGDNLIRNFLFVKDKEALDVLNISVEPEYFYDIDDITKLLQYGSLDEFLDCLDFAPVGVLSVIKELAVALPLNDVAKREAIREKLNFDVTRAIELAQDTEGEDLVEVRGKRRAAVPFKGAQDQQKEGSSGRRVQNK